MNLTILHYALISFVVAGVLWLIIGYMNYRFFMKALIVYETSYIKHKKLEELATDVAMQTKHFNEKEELTNKYPNLYRSMITKQEDEEAFEKNTRNSFLRYGILYNFT